jgi:hypothetical protein
MDYNWKSQFFFAVRYENLFLVGSHGMHRYNNQDHSMLTVAGNTGQRA